MYGKKVLALAAALVVASGCSSGGGYDPETTPTGGGPVAANAPIGWPVRTAEYVDLWLHAYALVSNDTAKVPLFERGYRDRMLDLRRQRNVNTLLDVNMAKLREGMAGNAGIEGGQFAVFSFESLDELVRVSRQFIQNEGSPNTVNDPTTQQLFLQLRTYFRTVAERDWLRTFVQSVEDEQAKFYLSYWNAQQIDRGPTLQAIKTAWDNTYKTKFQRYLRNERKVDGTFIPTLPLGGEGRAIFLNAGNGIATPLPATAADAMQAIYVFAHEIVGNAAQRAAEDNLTPAEAREGGLQKVLPIAQVRAGAVLLQRIAPELLEGYQRYYLRHSGATAPTGSPAAAFAATFTLPQVVVDGITRQIDLVLAGI